MAAQTTCRDGAKMSMICEHIMVRRHGVYDRRNGFPVARLSAPYAFHAEKNYAWPRSIT